jgi:uncharacterized OB-fold protein
VLVKIVSFFLIGMVALAMFGRLRVPGAQRLMARKCKACGKHLIGRAPCDCGSKRV